jgi:hypothetical protein
MWRNLLVWTKTGLNREIISYNGIILDKINRWTGSRTG